MCLRVIVTNHYIGGINQLILLKMEQRRPILIRFKPTSFNLLDCCAIKASNSQNIVVLAKRPINLSETERLLPINARGCHQDQDKYNHDSPIPNSTFFNNAHIQYTVLFMKACIGGLHKASTPKFFHKLELCQWL